jgi:CheY-like chemotaxis protein
MLLVEDEPVNQEVARLFLTDVGASTWPIAGNGAVAVDMAAQLAASTLILMDMQMPEMDGLEATRQHPPALAAGSTCPIVAMTANAFAEDRAQLHGRRHGRLPVQTGGAGPALLHPPALAAQRAAGPLTRPPGRGGRRGPYRKPSSTILPTAPPLSSRAWAFFKLSAQIGPSRACTVLRTTPASTSPARALSK